MFPFHYCTQFAFFKISWKNWKPNGIYKKMAEFLSNLDPRIPNKTPSQCKSYDERMKYLHYEATHESAELDLLEAALNNLQSAAHEPGTRAVLTNYLRKMEQRSGYMQFLSTEDGEPEERPCKIEEGPVSYEMLEVKTQRDLIYSEFFDDGEIPLAAKVF